LQYTRFIYDDKCVHFVTNNVKSDTVYDACGL